MCYLFFHFQGPEVFQTSERWARPKVPALDPKADRLTFQQVDIDYYMGKPMKGMPGAQSGTVPTMRIFGVTRDQNSLCCHVHGFAPYFYVTAPPQLQVSIQYLCLKKTNIKVNLFFYRPASVKHFRMLWTKRWLQIVAPRLNWLKLSLKWNYFKGKVFTASMKTGNVLFSR